MSKHDPLRPFTPHCVALAVTFLYTASAYAEPAPSMGHLPFLWLLGIGLSLLLSLLLTYLLGRFGLVRSKTGRWIAGVVLALIFMVWIVPLVTVFGSILITGRTM
jgi:hypothetical protein